MKIERHDSESDLLMDLYLPDLIRGDRGEKGDTGEKGERGDRGEKGRDGTGVNILGELERTADLPLAGNTGDGYLIDGNLYVWNPSIGGWLNAGNIKGPKGDTGEKGERGDLGSKGDTGATGLQGLTGEKGDRGDKGNRGDPGPQGATGEQGAKGNPGAKGDKGDTGAQGERGERGDMGEQGPAGEQGTQGERGNPGKDGSGLNVCGTLGSVEALPPLSTPGDAYFIGEHLYVFGSEGWIDGGSVKGERGDKGEQGAAGLQGEKGDTGAQGATGAQGLPGNPGAQGAKGDKGDTGAQGEKGDKGDSGSPDTKAQLIEKLNQPGEVVMSRHWVFTSGAGTVSTSDMRFKNHIEALSGTLAALLGAPIFRYHWREQPGVQIGTSAQYWQQHFPELVYEMQDADHTLTLSYERLTVVLLKAIQEQQQLIREQSRRLDALEAAISVNNP